MKKILLLGVFFIASCTAHPEYYSHSQNITLEGLPGYTNVYYRDKELKESEKDSDESENKADNPNQKQYKLERSWHDQEILIKKEGFEDYHLKLDSSMTSEPWATAKYMDSEEQHYFPLIGLLVPEKTIKEVVSIPVYLALSLGSLITLSPISFTENMTEAGVSLVSLPKALVLDLYDIISVPGTTIINPWTEFKYDSTVVLEPTQAMKQTCHQKSGSFISNNGCLACSSSIIVLYSSQEECAKCSNRTWDAGKCSLK